MDLEQAVAALPRGWHGHYSASVGSTQDEARAAASRGAPHRSIFVADEQTAGRGRHGRRWQAAPGTALLMSIVWRESAPLSPPVRWTALASLGLVDAIQRAVPGLQPRIKWPNDVLLDDRKVAGVLAESTSNGEHFLVVVGVGVNVSSSATDLAHVPSGAATSLRLASARDVDRGELLLAFVDALDALATLPISELMARWRKNLWGRDQRLTLVDVDGEVDVVVLGAELDGSLRVRLPDGTERLTTTGELIL